MFHPKASSEFRRVNSERLNRKKYNLGSGVKILFKKYSMAVEPVFTSFK